MKVSIALATYNGEPWLLEQLDSLARQTLLPCELVVSDDRSTDCTLEVVAQFAAAAPFPVRVIRNDTRFGFADNFMRALRHCTGEAVAYCDQDDVWSALKLERCAAAMLSDPAVTLVHHDLEEVDCHLRPLGIILRPHGSPVRGPRAQKHPVLRTWAVGCGMLMHRRLVDAVLSYWPKAHLRYVESSGSLAVLGHDTATLVMASVLGTVVYIPDVLIQHRRHQHNTWSADLALPARLHSLPFEQRAAVAENSSQFLVLSASMYEEMAEQARASGDSPVSRHLALLANRHLKSARLYAARAQLYRTESTIDRCLRLAKMLHDGVYRGIGSASVAVRYSLKDLAFVLGGPGAPQLLEAMLRKLRRNLLCADR
jgi:glycosyltransferase involved in cell wall biosynthesis